MKRPLILQTLMSPLPLSYQSKLSLKGDMPGSNFSEIMVAGSLPTDHSREHKKRLFH